ncbi:MAG TPA: peptidoglycan DD-metalloendopeptidase family protein [Bacillota bacterium]|nr:peptidoglycan DD-metalloendopeptidase family protein [Bacillota bacterium]
MAAESTTKSSAAPRKLQPRRAVKLISAFLCAIILLLQLPGGGVIVTVAEDTNAAIAKLRDQIKENEKKQAEYKAEIASAKNQINSFLQQKYYLDRQIALKEQNIELTEKLIEEYEQEIVKTKTRLAEKEGILEKKYDDFRTQLRLAYEDQDYNLLEILFSSESLIDFLINAERTAILLDYQSTLLNDLKLEAEDLNNLKLKYENMRAEQLKTKSDLEEKKEELERQQSYALTYIKNKERELRKNEEEYQKLVRYNEELDAQLEKLLQEIAARSQQVYVGGKYIWPLDLKYNRISSGFTKRTFNGVTEFHKGLDIPANAGANIYAANAGTVVTANYHYSYGNYVIIDHGGGQATLYAHCSKILVKVGDKVKQGDVIAKVGTTGYSSGNHLHFEVRINGVAVNPLDGYVVKP